MHNKLMYSLDDAATPSAVEEQVGLIYSRLYPNADLTFVSRAFDWTKQCFSGHYNDYQAIDTRYHNLEHTLQGTLCMTRLIMGHHLAQAAPAVPQKMFELGVLAILLHDTGYLKKKTDIAGTGAKYTATHVLRSAEFARELLSEKGYAPEEIAAVQNMIRCTGLQADIKSIVFKDELEKLMGFALATADLLGQMAAQDYVQKLRVLYEEFAEAVSGDPQHSQQLMSYSSAEDVVRRTPAFWKNYVLPRINHDLGKLYLYLNDPYPDGPNPYLQGIEANMARIRKTSS